METQWSIIRALIKVLKSVTQLILDYLPAETSDFLSGKKFHCWLPVMNTIIQKTNTKEKASKTWSSSVIRPDSIVFQDLSTN